MPERSVELSSALSASADAVWAHASTMDGVNLELAPWVRMTVPSAARGRRLSDAEPGREAFASVLLLLGLVPFDVHHLTLARVDARGFQEDSWSWLQRRWRHERQVDPTPGGCVVTDRVVFTPRLGGPLAAALVRAVFTARHRKLRALFGG